MNFLDAETDDADFRGAARVAMVLKRRSRVTEKKISRDDVRVKNSRGRKKDAIDEQRPLKIDIW